MSIGILFLYFEGKLTLNSNLSYLGWVKSASVESSTELYSSAKIPNELNGILYRNGPALFERGGVTKPYYVDGDGMVHSFLFEDGKAHYRNRFVRTKKFLEESKAGKFLYDTWTVKAPKENVAPFSPAELESQAFVSAVYHHNKLFAFDESLSPYELDPNTLETIGPSNLGTLKTHILFSAHSKIQTRQQQWIHFGLQHDKKTQVHFTILNDEGKLLKHFTRELPRAVYMHDFFATENYLVLCLQPAFIRIQSFLSGSKSFLDSIRWKPEEGNLVLVFDKSGEQQPLVFEADARWWLHSINAWEYGEDLFLDFVAHSSPDHFLGKSPMYKDVLSGCAKGPYAPGEIWRYQLNVNNVTLKEERLFKGNHEFPTIHPDKVGVRNRYAYLVKGSNEIPFWNTLIQVDFETGQNQEFCFGTGVYCSEPIMAPKNRGVDFETKENEGYVMSLIYDGNNNKHYLALFRGGHFEKGPIACIDMKSEIPLTFHGCWRGM